MVHIEINPLWNPVLMGEMPPGPKHAGLDILVGINRDGLDEVIIGAEVVKGSVFVAKYLYGYRRRPHIFIVGVDFCPRR